MNSFLSVVRGCQDIMGMLVLGGVFERHPDLQGRLRRGRRRLGAALHVPDGPRLQPPPLLAAAGPAAVEAAERVLRREHLRHVPGRLDRVPLRRRHELAAADVGQRLPAHRLDLAVVAGAARRAHGPADRRAAARAILCDNVAELYNIDRGRRWYERVTTSSSAAGRSSTAPARRRAPPTSRSTTA